MPTDFVLTLTGPDRIGMVDKVTRLLLDHGGNVETSRMVRLGGSFAILMLVAIPTEQLAVLDRELTALTEQGYKVTTTRADQTDAEAHRGWLPYQIEVQGADHEGIIHQVAHYLSERSINIESIDSETSAAPISGSPLFSMTAQVVVPPSLPGQDWERGLEEIGNAQNLEITVTALDREAT